VKVLNYGFVERLYVGWSWSVNSSMADNSTKGSVLCFGKSQHGVTFSCSRLTDIGSMVYSTGQGLFVMDVGVENIFDAKNTCLDAC
jgi:hypothetical protein